MSEKYKLNVRKKLSDLGNNGMMMLIVLVCPQILKEAELLKVSKCAKLTEGIFRETLPNQRTLRARLAVVLDACHAGLRAHPACLHRSGALSWQDFCFNRLTTEGCRTSKRNGLQHDPPQQTPISAVTAFQTHGISSGHHFFV